MNSPVNIRPYTSSDMPQLIDICLRTADYGKNGTHLFHSPQLPAELFALPYIAQESHLCLLATQNDKPLGYILGTADTEHFAKWADTHWFPNLRNKYLKTMAVRSETEALFLKMLHQPICERLGNPPYPAHLHIDLLPEIQGRGAGRQLVDAFVAQLAKKEVPGVYVDVSRFNAKAIAFYQHVEFQIHKTAPWGVQMLRKIP